MTNNQSFPSNLVARNFYSRGGSLLQRGLAAFLATLLLLFLVPSSQASADTFGWKWVTTTIPVYANTSTTWQVDKAITNWNAKNNVHLYRVFTPITNFGINIYEQDLSAAGDVGGWAEFSNLGTVNQTCTVTLKRLTSTLFQPTATTHELGHCLGLDHTTHKGSIMNIPLSITAPNLPSSWDYNQLATLYPSSITKVTRTGKTVTSNLI
jgi:predicted Zn-dependent protease